jgi:hypothetical protein
MSEAKKVMSRERLLREKSPFSGEVLKLVAAARTVPVDVEFLGVWLDRAVLCYEALLALFKGLDERLEGVVQRLDAVEKRVSTGGKP